MFESDTLSMGR